MECEELTDDGASHSIGSDKSEKEEEKEDEKPNLDSLNIKVHQELDDQGNVVGKHIHFMNEHINDGHKHHHEGPAVQMGHDHHNH